MISKRTLGLALLLLAGCGKQGALAPVPPNPPPVAPVNAARAPTPEEMLQQPTQSIPTRVDDPIRNSQERPDDRFNLPPPRD
jgi:hypothetical protein